MRDQCIACSVHLDDQSIGVYAGDHDCYKDFKDFLHPIILDYHGQKDGFKHISDMDASKLVGRPPDEAEIHSTRVRVGRNIEGFGLSPGITMEQRIAVEKLMINSFRALEGEFAGEYYPLTGMSEDPNLQIAGMEREWPASRGIFLNKDKTFLVWVNEEDQLRIISM